MRVKVSGLVMELKTEFDEKKNKLATVTAMIFQKGEKSLVAVKKVPDDLVFEGENVEDLPVRVTAYSFDGNFGMSCVYRL
jgi:predicted regulator of Ras-like GTPase activity (Roadblock/LC7/MglB family)